MEQLKAYWHNHPLKSLLIIGGLFRLIAVIFSKGWGMHDDHFLVIEAAQSILDGADYNNWIPDNPQEGTPGGHSFFYPFLHLGFFWILDSIASLSPQTKMTLVRLVHALISLLPIIYVFKITERLSNTDTARKAGLFMAILWIMPILSVRNLVEVVCLPPLLASSLYLLRFESEKRNALLMFAGILAGIAMGIRFQIALFIGGAGLVLLSRKQIVPAVLYGLFAFVGFFISQSADLYVWERPFAEFMEYVRYNIEHKTSYFDRPWYMYLLTVGGLLIPPISLFLFFGFFRNIKKHLIIFLPAFIFFAFHSYFPNKQERFIIPFLPYLIMLGFIGWQQWIKNSNFWNKNVKLLKGFWIWFWVLNTILLLVLTPAYTKRNRAEAMTWLYHQDDFNNMIIESSHKNDFLMPAQYYLGEWKQYFYVTAKKHSADLVRTNVENVSDDLRPNYVVFFEQEKLEERKARFEKGYGKPLELAVVVEPSYIDALLFKLNPNNDNQTTHIYRIVE